MTPRRLAVIPARGGSKRLPNKNVRVFAGRPMIAHILETARASELFSTIHVSTENKRIAALVEEFGVRVDFPRLPALAADDTPLLPVLRFVTEKYAERGEIFDEVWLLMACAPLIEPQDLEGAARLFGENGGRWPVLGVAPYPAPIEWAFEGREDGRLFRAQTGKLVSRSQDFAPKYYDVGAFCGFPVQQIRESSGGAIDTGFIGYLLPRHKAVDINTEEDWQLAEMLFSARRLAAD
jgi:N-acylneuraminate cytidylyltransferase